MACKLGGKALTGLITEGTWRPLEQAHQGATKEGRPRTPCFLLIVDSDFVFHVLPVTPEAPPRRGPKARLSSQVIYRPVYDTRAAQAKTRPSRTGDQRQSVTLLMPRRRRAARLSARGTTGGRRRRCGRGRGAAWRREPGERRCGGLKRAMEALA